MTKKKRERLYLFGGVFIAAAIAVGLTLTALSGSITYFYTPSDLAKLDAPPQRPIRLGGLVADKSVEYAQSGSGELVSFIIEDGAAAIRVSYAGILPDLFREGQGVIVEGRLVGADALNADTVLAKHDENYMPKEVADALKEQGHWQEEAQGPGY
ncbi:MAG: cytochrome c maturation protein CcmE [Pseudomonadota bacterium]